MKLSPAGAGVSVLSLFGLYNRYFCAVQQKFLAWGCVRAGQFCPPSAGGMVPVGEAMRGRVILGLCSGAGRVWVWGGGWFPGTGGGAVWGRVGSGKRQRGESRGKGRSGGAGEAGRRGGYGKGAGTKVFEGVFGGGSGE